MMSCMIALLVILGFFCWPLWLLAVLCVLIDQSGKQHK